MSRSFARRVMALRDHRVNHRLAAVVALGGLLRVWGLWFGLPHAEARPDESVAIACALRILGGDLNPHFFHWPSLHLYVLAGLYAAFSPVLHFLGLVGGTLTFSDHALIGRGYVAAAGTLTIVALYTLARQMVSSSTALAAASFLAVAPLHVRDSHFAMTDVVMSLLVTVSLSLLLDATRRLEGAPALSPARRVPDGLGGFALAGVVGGLAASTKYNASATLAAAGLAQAWLWRRAARRSRPLAWVPLASFVLCFAIGFVVATPFAVLDAARFWADVQFTFTHLSQGHGVNLGRGWLQHVLFSLPFGLGVPLFIAGLGGLAVARREPRSATILAGFAVAFYLSVGSGYTVFARYVMPLVPLFCLSAALLLERLSVLVAARVGAPPGRILALATGLVMLPSLVTSVHMDVLLGRTDTRVLAARWLSEQLPRDATVYESGGEYLSLAIGSERLHRWYFDPQSGRFEGATAGALPQWLVIHESPLRQYTPVSPVITRLARDGYVLVKAFDAATDESRPIDYDQQDAFFLPLRNLGSVVRPGTNISIYRRHDRTDDGG